MPNFSELTHRPLKIIFAFHLLGAIGATQGAWCPDSVIMYNILFFLSIMWAIHNSESDEPLQFALFLNVVAMVSDLMVLIIFYSNIYGAWAKFCASALAINMVGRAFSSIYLLRIGQERNGSLASIFVAVPPMGFGRQDYEDISHPIPHATISEFDRI